MAPSLPLFNFVLQPTLVMEPARAGHGLARRLCLIAHSSLICCVCTGAQIKVETAGQTEPGTQQGNSP
eukprot:2731233-Pyramimonas_sp.AAC.1